MEIRRVIIYTRPLSQNGHYNDNPTFRFLAQLSRSNGNPTFRFLAQSSRCQFGNCSSTRVGHGSFEVGNGSSTRVGHGYAVAYRIASTRPHQPAPPAPSAAERQAETLRVARSVPGFCTATTEIGQGIATAGLNGTKLLKKKNPWWFNPRYTFVKQRAVDQVEAYMVTNLQPYAAKAKELSQAIQKAHPDLPVKDINTAISTQFSSIASATDAATRSNKIAKKLNASWASGMQCTNGLWEPAVDIMFLPRPSRNQKLFLTSVPYSSLEQPTLVIDRS